jgi:hypothetical protein
VEPFLRDTRHLAGRTPISRAPRPSRSGLALGVRHTDAGTPYLLVGDKDGQIHPDAAGDRLNLLVEAGRHCVGTIQDNTWTACPHANPADRFTRCTACHPLPVRECVFNPRCNDCTQPFCRSPHEVYIAYQGNAKKVGMTRKAREGERLVEQGADMAFIVAETEDRFQARNLEDRITALLGIPQVLPQKTRLTRLRQEPPTTSIQQDHQQLRPRLEAITGRSIGPLVAPPRGKGLPLQETPVPAATIGHHMGTIEAAHGRYLFYRNETESQNGPLWALDLKDVVTHPVRHE